MAVLAPALVVSVVAIALWLATGVDVASIGLFLGYQVLFVLLPGFVAVAVLVRWPLSGLARLVFAMALGEALLAGAFALTAAIGARELLWAYPAVVLAPAPFLLRRRAALASDPATAEAQPGRGRAWVLAGICIAALVALALQSWLEPLPGSVASVSYGLDDVWNLSLVAEARHHWPLTDPTAAGTALPYHWFTALNAASASQVTGLSLPLVFFRLYLVPLLIVAVLGLSEAGSMIARRSWAGPAAAFLALFAGEIDLDPVHGLTFGNEIANDVLGLSPTFLAGLVFFLPLLMLLAVRLQSPARTAGWRWWVVWVLLLAGAASAKATILPVLGLGLALWLVAWGWRRGWPAVHGLVAPWLAVGGVYALSYWVLYRGAGSSGLVIDPPGAIRQMRGIEFVTAAFHGHPLGALVLWPLVIVVGLVGAYGAAMVGLPWLLSRGRPLAASQALMLCLLAAGLIPFLLFTHPGLSQAYFGQYGVIAASTVSAAGLCRLAEEARGRRAAAVWWLAAAGIALATAWVLARQSDHWRSWIPILDLAVAGIVAVALILAFAFGRRRGAVRWVWPSVIGALIVAALNTPLDVTPHVVDRVLAGHPPYVQAGRQVTPGIAQGLNWVRRHSSPDAVLAVNNYSTHRARRHRPAPTPDEYIYSALAERRVFLEGWVYANRSFEIGAGAVSAGRRQPFPVRRRLNDAVFRRADRHALSILARRYGVRFLVVDRIHGDASPRLGQVARLAYGNRDMTIYSVTASR